MQAEGRLATMKKAANVVIPTVKGLYYNWQLAKECHYHYFESNEQQQLLELVGFRPVSDTKVVYVDQAFLDSAVK